MNTEEKKLSDILKEHTDARSMNNAKLAEASGVPERYIAALSGGEFASLPPAPYVRGYLFKIAAVLETPGNELWQYYKKEVAPQSSGALDRLPSNRFSIQPLSKKWAMVAVAAAGLGTYLVLQLPSILGTPSLHLTNYGDEKTYTIATSLIVLSGSVKPGDKITLNNESVYADGQGSFEKEILLQKGLNTVEIKVNRFLGREKKVTRQFDYQPKEEQPQTRSATQQIPS